MIERQQPGVYVRSVNRRRARCFSNEQQAVDTSFRLSTWKTAVLLDTGFAVNSTLNTVDLFAIEGRRPMLAMHFMAE